MSETDLVIFDLDGTLIDSKLDLAHSVNATRQYMGLPPLDHELIFSYVGNGAPMLVQRAMGPQMSAEDVKKALDYFLQYYREHLLDYTTLYPGVTETIEALYERGVRMAVLTNKPVRMSTAIVAGLNLGDKIFRVFGGNSFDQKKPHPIGVETLLTEARIGPERALMVGDSGVDVQTARNAGIRVCGVTYGFQPETLDQFPPDYLIDNMSQLLKIVSSAAA